MDGCTSRLLSVCGELIALWLICMDENLMLASVSRLLASSNEGLG